MLWFRQGNYSEKQQCIRCANCEFGWMDREPDFPKWTFGERIRYINRRCNYESQFKISDQLLTKIYAKCLFLPTTSFEYKCTTKRNLLDSGSNQRSDQGVINAPPNGQADK